MIDPYATGILSKSVHDRIVADKDRIAEDIGIEVHWLWTSMKTVCSDNEVSWVQRFNYHKHEGCYGLAFVGTNYGDIATRMAAIAAALTRNFINAKVMTFGQVADAMSDQTSIDTTCLLIPNFFEGKSHGGSHPSWKVSMVNDCLSQRRVSGLQTVLYVADLTALGFEYGLAVRRLVTSYIQVQP